MNAFSAGPARESGPPALGPAVPPRERRPAQLQEPLGEPLGPFVSGRELAASPAPPAPAAEPPPAEFPVWEPQADAPEESEESYVEMDWLAPDEPAPHAPADDELPRVQPLPAWEPSDAPQPAAELPEPPLEEADVVSIEALQAEPEAIDPGWIPVEEATSAPEPPLPAPTEPEPSAAEESELPVLAEPEPLEEPWTAPAPEAALQEPEAEPAPVHVEALPPLVPATPPAQPAPENYVEEIAVRLERIARALRHRSPDELFGSTDDPLEMLVAGYVLGISAAERRAAAERAARRDASR